MITAQEQDPALTNMISPALVLQSIKMEVVTLIESLPETNYAVLKGLIQFFVLVEQNSGMFVSVCFCFYLFRLFILTLFFFFFH